MIELLDSQKFGLTQNWQQLSDHELWVHVNIDGVEYTGILHEVQE